VKLRVTSNSSFLVGKTSIKMHHLISERDQARLVIDLFDNLAYAGHFETIDKIMAKIDPQEAPIQILVSWLMVTYSTRDKYKNRGRLAAAIKQRKPEEAGEILKGLDV